jgi:dienelactone hydrolase
MKALSSLFCIIALISTLSCKAADDIDIETFQPPIITDFVPDEIHGFSIQRNIKRYKLNPFIPQVMSYNGKGTLLASWNPRPNISEKYTFIVVHGGHGVAPGNFSTAKWLIDTFDANVLILDSYWSRGKTDNWKALTEFGANMRVLDSIAAARYTKSLGADPSKTFLIGDSQGGWTVLRTFTAHNLQNEVDLLYKGGVAMYPNCIMKKQFFGADRFAPLLGPYTKKVIAFFGSIDSATPISQCEKTTITSTTKSMIFDQATHAWDAPMPDGTCTNAANIYNRFPICRSDKYTNIMHDEIIKFTLMD